MGMYNAQKYQRIIFTRGLTLTARWCWCSPNVKCKYLVVRSATQGLRDTWMGVIHHAKRPRVGACVVVMYSSISTWSLTSGASKAASWTVER